DTMTTAGLHVDKTTTVELGILAHNEELGIAATLRSLLDQDLFGDPQVRLRVTVVANGCSDATDEVAALIFSDEASKRYPRHTFLVKRLPEAGKCNAWNTYVHQVMGTDADYVGLMDADILLPETGTLTRLLYELRTDAGLTTAVSRPVKEAALRPRRRLWEKV